MSETPARDPIQEADAVIEESWPALWAALSPLGRRVRQPANFLPLQTAEARGKPFNATIGQITDGRGRAVPLPAMAAAVPGLDEARRSQAFLYSPVEGLADLRHLWRERQRREIATEVPSSLPIVTLGPVHGLSLVADLFSPDTLSVIASPGEAERASLRDSLREKAAQGPRVVAVDDTEEEDPRRSLFWDLIGLHENLVPVKVDGADSLGFAGGRVGFLTFAFEAESPLARAFESKVKILLRATVGSPSATSQALLIQVLEGRKGLEGP